MLRIEGQCKFTRVSYFVCHWAGNGNGITCRIGTSERNHQQPINNYVIAMQNQKCTEKSI